MDSSLFDPEQDMDLVVMINEARTEAEVQSVVRMSRARMRARRAQLEAVRAPRRRGALRALPFAPGSLIRS